MAVHVLVEFDDNAAAKRFTQKVNGHWGAVDGNHLSRRVIGIFYAPTKFCDCTTSGMKKGNPFYRSNKTGWWVHWPCGKPTEVWGKLHNHWSSAIGRNVLPGNHDYQPQGWGTTPTDHDAEVAYIVPLGDDQIPVAVTGERLKKHKRRERERPRRQ